MNFITDTIAAIATPPGTGGIAILRVSGEKALTLVEPLFQPKQKNLNIKEYPRCLIYGHIMDADEVIDEVLLSYMPGPASYTGEDVVEINTHGGYVVVERIFHLILKQGVRFADAGEFTKRAFLNGRIDLTQAEAIYDIIEAKTDKGLSIAQQQLKGSLSRKIEVLREDVTAQLAQLTAAIDFPEEDDVPEITSEQLVTDLTKTKQEIERLLASFSTGKIYREGIHCVIVGKPNVGKSSLLNALLEENRAIVTDIAGTTRDVIEEHYSLDGIPLRIVDTAGIRESSDPVEQIGVEKSRQNMEEADLLLVMFDASLPFEKEDADILADVSNPHSIAIVNKLDRKKVWDYRDNPDFTRFAQVLELSIRDNPELEEVKEAVRTLLTRGDLRVDQETILSNVRHKQALEKAKRACDDALEALALGISFDVVETDFKQIWTALGEITGDTVQEDLLTVIFSKFCIGK